MAARRTAALAELLDAWGACQGLWLALEARRAELGLGLGPGMRRSSAVQGFGAAWRRIVACVQGDAPTALELTERDGLAEDLRMCRAQLEGALRSLAPVEDTPRDE